MASDLRQLWTTSSLVLVTVLCLVSCTSTAPPVHDEMLKEIGQTRKHAEVSLYWRTAERVWNVNYSLPEPVEQF